MGTPSRMRPESSPVARAALMLGTATLLASLASSAAWIFDAISRRQMEFLLVFCLGGSVLTGTLAAIGWMHAQRRATGRFDPVGVRLSLAAGLLSCMILVGVTFGLDRLDSEHAVRTHVSPAEELAR
ncbi:MAG: hypothetical protein R3F21_25875 [Myxococcota bacterium]